MISARRLSVNRTILRPTYPVSVLALTAISVPVGLDAAGMPVGLQLIARGGHDEALLGVLQACQDLMNRYEIVGDVRGGHGLMTALELVSDRAAKTPLDKDTVGRIFETVYGAGVMIRISGNNIILSPPLVITTADVQKIVGAIEEGLAAA